MMVLLGHQLINQDLASLLLQQLKLTFKHNFGHHQMPIQDFLGLRFLELTVVMEVVLHFRYILNTRTLNCSVSLHDLQEETIMLQTLEQVKLDGVLVETQILHLQETKMIGEVELMYLITLLIFQQVQMQQALINLQEQHCGITQPQKHCSSLKIWINLEVET